MPLTKIALEEHFLDPRAAADVLADPDKLRRLSDGGGVMPEYYRPILSLLGDFDDQRLSTMDKYGIECSVLSLTAPGVQLVDGIGEAVAVARDANDLLAEQVRKHPDRYRGFASVALQDPAAAAEELRRCVHDLGFAGAMINGYTATGDGGDAYLDDERFTGFWEAVADLGVPVYLHPRPAPPTDRHAIAGHPQLVGATWGFGVETATHTLRLIFSGLFDRFPGVQLVLGHLGEGLPAQLWRTQYCYDLNPFDKRIEKTLPEYFADNIHVTTSGNFSDQALITALLTVGGDRILFSVDYPYADTELATTWLDRAPISESDRRKIASGNARTLFKL